MPSWNALLNELMEKAAAEGEQAAGQWLQDSHVAALQAISAQRGGTNVIFYASGFLQKQQAPATTLQIVHEDVNGLMAVIYGMDCSRGLTLILHTPGGVVNAAESIVAYLRSKFDYIEVIVPAFSMSAGTMISLASNKILMGRQSQLGPIDPQMNFGGQSISARAVVDQFDRGRSEILANQAAAHVWAPILQSAGPSLLVEAQNALSYGQSMVAGWLARYMFAGHADADARGHTVAGYFNDASTHMSHGRRIDLAEVQAQGLDAEAIEYDQSLQEAVLTAYHLTTLSFERGLSVKFMLTDSNGTWVKSWVNPLDLQVQQLQQQLQQAPPPQA